MADQNSQFMAILTAVGEARLANAQALGIAWNITQLGVGDGNGAEPMPDRLQTELVNERRRAPLNQIKVDPSNASIIIAEQVIPEDVGGWWIREIGLYDEAGDLVAVANCPPTFKPQLAQGSGRTQVVRLNLLVSSTQSITLKIDPSVVLATRAYCDGKIAEELAKLDHKQSVRAATTANIALNGLQTIDGIVLVAGDRVLVKNQAAAKDNGLYIAAAGAWSRADDADMSVEVTPGLVVHVEQGTTMADSRWQLVTDGAIVLGTTALTFQDVTKGYAPLASPIFTGDPKAPTPAQFDNDPSLATTEFVQRALGNYSGFAALTVSRSLTAADLGRVLWPDGSGKTLTLPSPVSLGAPVGAAVSVFCTVSSVSLAVVAGAGSAIQSSSGSTGNYTIKTGQFAKFVVVGPGVWQVVFSSADLGNNSDFASSLANPGWRKLPSGEIEQWATQTLPAVGAYNQQSIGGTTFYTNYYAVTYPLAFPNTVFEAETTLACSSFSAQISMAGASASLNLSGTGNALTGMTIAITTPVLGYVPTIHWRSRGK
ncbi:phage tail protein [Pseudomonas aeruginosa]|uniref:phage tail protein n=1 Tax=Pseudomonas aeruginosa TaxID=287 RepID=UPI00069C8EDA|nr:phage tail protein [Pseudomonas aeruginosa]RTU53867.1 phage tail protein [Pseudomonas aeruginosa]